MLHIFECRETEQSWMENWFGVEKVMLLEMKNDVRLYDIQQKLIFIVSGLGRYVNE